MKLVYEPKSRPEFIAPSNEMVVKKQSKTHGQYEDFPPSSCLDTCDADPGHVHYQCLPVDIQVQHHGFSFLLSVALEEKVNVNGIDCQTRDFSLVSARYF